MEQLRATRCQTQAMDSRTGESSRGALPLDAHFGELIETVWQCERQWILDDRINAAIKYGS